MTAAERALLEACRAWTGAADEEERQAVRERVREALARLPDPAEREERGAFDDLIAAASSAGEAVEIFAPLESIPAAVPVVLPSGAWRDEPLPAPVLWRDRDASCDERGAPAHAVVSEGEVAVLAGAGKGGKSYVTLALGVAAAAAEREGRPYGSVCGLRVRAGRIAVLSYEDAARRIDQRVESMGGERDDVWVVRRPAPVYGYDRRSGRWGRTRAWRGVWAKLRAVAPDIVAVVVDTGPKAMGGETNDPGAVIGFLHALELEAQEMGVAALVLAHDTKAGRDAARSGAELDAGVVAGSGQWHDSPRGLLHLAKMGGGDAPRLLECVKASYGPDGWGARLQVRFGPTGRYAGPELADRLDEEELRQARREYREARAQRDVVRSGKVRGI